MWNIFVLNVMCTSKSKKNQLYCEKERIELHYRDLLHILYIYNFAKTFEVMNEIIFFKKNSKKLIPRLKN